MLLYIILVLLIGVAIGRSISNRIYGKALDEAREYWRKYLDILGWIADTPIPYSEEEYAKHLRKLHDIISYTDEKKEDA